MGVILAMVEKELGERNFGLDSALTQSRATIPFSSMSRFSLLQIDVEVEEPEIQNIVWRYTQI